MQPPALLVRVDLRPHVVGDVEHPSALEADCARDEAETIGPLAAAAAPRAQQHGRVVVTGKARDMAIGAYQISAIDG